MPELFVEIEFGPTQLSDFAHPLPDQNQELGIWAERPAVLLTRLPNRGELTVAENVVALAALGKRHGHVGGGIDIDQLSINLHRSSRPSLPRTQSEVRSLRFPPKC